MARPLHILLVDDYSSPTLGGGERHLLWVARGCREFGHRVTIACTPGSGLESEARSAGFDTAVVPARTNPLGVRSGFKQLFRSIKPDVVHTHGFYVMLASSKTAKRAGVPYVLTTVHNMPSAPLDLKPGFRGRMEHAVRSVLFRRTARWIDRYICVVEPAASEIITIGVDASKVVVIPNGIPDPLAGHGVGESAHHGEVLVGSVGRLEILKDQASFVDAAAIVSRSHAETHFRLVGDGSLRGALERRVASLGLGERFELVGWSTDPLSEIAAMDVYVVSSVTDTTNLTVLEAMGLGKAVVATAVGGIPDAVVDGVTGRLVPPRRPDLLAEAIEDLVADAALRGSMGAEGRIRFEARFTVERMLEAHALLYASLAAS